MGRRMGGANRSRLARTSPDVSRGISSQSNTCIAIHLNTLISSTTPSAAILIISAAYPSTQTLATSYGQNAIGYLVRTA